jgi:hypothetical protein
MGWEYRVVGALVGLALLIGVATLGAVLTAGAFGLLAP